MITKKRLPIGNDNFRKLRENGSYYVDKTLMIRDFIEMQDEVALIARPRRFGKTLNMTMLREFFDITADSSEIFEGLNIMETEYAAQMNSRPVIYFTFKNCKGVTIDEFTVQLKRALKEEYARYDQIFREKPENNSFSMEEYRNIYNFLRNSETAFIHLSSALLDLTRAVYEFYNIRPILLIDEYDQPIMSSYEHGYHEQVGFRGGGYCMAYTGDFLSGKG